MSKQRYVLQWEDQPKYFCKVLCSLLEGESMVDLTITCNSHTIKVHKCVLAANSTYFREQLQRDMSIDRLVINGLRYSVLKALIEFIYCGEASLLEEHFHELVAAAKFFCIKGITAIIPEKLGIEGVQDDVSDFNLTVHPPIFYSRNEKIRSFPKIEYDFTEDVKIFNDYSPYCNKPNSYQDKTVEVTDEAHVALAKEEAASRFALEMLKKDLTNTANVFEIDETCTEATVETNLTAQYENNDNVMQIEEFILDKNEDTENGNVEMCTLTNGIEEMQVKQSPAEKQIDSVAYHSKILENENLSFEIVQEGSVKLQYICNDYGEFSVVADSTSDANYKILKPEGTAEKVLTYNELVADVVNVGYDSSSPTEPYQDSEEYSIQEVPEFKEAEVLEDSGTPKKRRGRPPKRKSTVLNEITNVNGNSVDLIESNQSEDMLNNVHEVVIKPKKLKIRNFELKENLRNNEEMDIRNGKDLSQSSQSVNMERIPFSKKNRRQTRLATKHLLNNK